MLFNSLYFAMFFVLVAGVHFALPQRFRWAWLLAASCWFYWSFIPVYLLLLAGMVVVGYVTGLLMEKSIQPQKRLWLTISVVTNLGALGIFKYFNFFNTNLHALADAIGWNYSIESLSLALPVALSFVTFQALSYSFEIYAGRMKAERHFGIFSLFIFFFPKLLAGPIERPQTILPQFREKMAFDYDRVTSGLKLIAWGFFKKTVVADRLALTVSPIFDQYESASGPMFLLAALFYTFQIYYDFSGYTDIARGTARILGFRLMENFNFPNFAHSIGDFWRRWHISLSGWFREYIYFPMGGSRKGYARQCVNLLTVFLVTGLWHGANWTFIAWGMFHGILITLEMSNKKLPARFQVRFPSGVLGMALSITTTFTLVMLGRILFRSSDLSQAVYILSNLTSGWSMVFDRAWQNAQLEALNMGRRVIVLGALGILAVEFVHVLQVSGKRFGRLLDINQWNAAPRWAFYSVVTWLILLGYAENPDAFIYFRF